MSEETAPKKKIGRPRGSRTRKPEEEYFAPQVKAEGIDANGKPIKIEADSYELRGETHVFTRYRNAYTEREYVSSPRRLIVREPAQAVTRTPPFSPEMRAWLNNPTPYAAVNTTPAPNDHPQYWDPRVPAPTGPRIEGPPRLRAVETPLGTQTQLANGQVVVGGFMPDAPAGGMG